MQSQGVFFLFAGFSLIAIFYVYFFMAETKGLSDREKKALYLPGKKYGRKLRPGEQAQDIPVTLIAYRHLNGTEISANTVKPNEYM